MGVILQQDETALKAAVRFQVNVELENIKLIECTAEALRDAPEDDADLRVCLNIETKVVSIGKGVARFAVKITAEGTPKETSDDASALFRIVCGHQLSYRINPAYSPKEEEIAAFREGNTVFHCWPYSREVIQNLAMRMELSISPLPALRVVPKVSLTGQVKKITSRKTKKA